MRRGQPVMPRVEEVAQDAEEVEIHKPRLVRQQERAVPQHLLERLQPLRELRQQLLSLPAPLFQAAAAELALLVADKAGLVGGGHHLAPVHIVQLEAHRLDFVLDIAPEDGLLALHLPREQPEPQFGIEVFGDDLRIFAYLEDHGLAVPDEGHAIVTLAAQLPDPRTVAAGDVGNFKAGAGELEDAALDNTVRAPGKLKQLNHIAGSNSPRATLSGRFPGDK